MNAPIHWIGAFSISFLSLHMWEQTPQLIGALLQLIAFRCRSTQVP
ncbi:MAG: hypothetical protein ABI599_11580 [Flavobacteriales bacterium]